MRCEGSRIVRPVHPLSAETEEADSVSGLDEWLALQAWRANWRPEPDPARNVEELAVVLRRAMRAGYAAFWTGAKAMPELFALDSTLACMWQEGYASAGREASLDVMTQPVFKPV